jgi:hypothetical protein
MFPFDYVRFKISMAMKIQFVGFWVVPLSILVGGYQRFGGTCSPHLQARSLQN